MIFARIRNSTTLLKSKNPLYQPTPFWAQACEQLTIELEEIGINKFRCSKTALSFFVPTYGPPSLGLNKEQVTFLLQAFEERYPQSKKAQLTLNSVLSGASDALGAYRTLAATRFGTDGILERFTESKIGSPIEQFEFDGKIYSRSSLNYLLGLCFLARHVDLRAIRNVMEIGGGFGTLGEIISSVGLRAPRYINIDIPPTHSVAEYYLSQVFGEKNVAGFESYVDPASVDIESMKPINCLCSWQIEKLVGVIDLFVNFISFQEMEPEVVRNYLFHVDRLKPKWILLRNLKEGKQKRSGGGHGVVTPIKSEDYNDFLPNYNIIDRNVYPFGHQTVDGFHSEVLILRRQHQ